MNEESTKKKGMLSYKEAGQIVREQREKLGLTRNELAISTRIATNIIEAIEEGWTSKFPEPAYLRAMLNQLEIQLELKKGSLKSALQIDTSPPLQHPRALTGRFRATAGRWRPCDNLVSCLDLHS